MEAEPQHLSGHYDEVGPIPVHISYEIIKLFSEGLYKSPHKAIEELVSNSYDAEASQVHIVLPKKAESSASNGLWVVDDGIGMTASGFHQLWKVASSEKNQPLGSSDGRQPIGQFGIGKLAAYVLAWELTHISKSGGTIHMTHMDFRHLENVHQYEEAEPFSIKLLKLSEQAAREAMSDLSQRSPKAWDLLFGPQAAPSWTAACLTNFRQLFDDLLIGPLNWVLSTALPLRTDFRLWLDNRQLKSSKEDFEPLFAYNVGGDDQVAREMAASRHPISSGSTGVQIEGIAGTITGRASIYERSLVGKSDRFSRSNGFFVRVRKRIINLDDGRFGLKVQNYAAWSRFEMDLDADGLRDHLLSSREGVRSSKSINTLRGYLHGVFKQCRNSYETWKKQQMASMDLENIMRDAPSPYLTDPLVESVKRRLDDGLESFYVAQPILSDTADQRAWLSSFRRDLEEQVFGTIQFVKSGRYSRALEFRPESRTLNINSDHPFIDKLISTRSKSKLAGKLFASSELLIDALLQNYGFGRDTVMSILADRDRVLRFVAGEYAVTPNEVLHLLDIANQDRDALEQITGRAFQILGFEYEKRGGTGGGPDGVLFARLGHYDESKRDYKVVYDTKQSSSGSVPADRIDISQLISFLDQESADYGFFLANRYRGEGEPKSAINRKINSERSRANPLRVTLLRIKDLKRLIELHCEYGIPLTSLRSLFDDTNSVPEVRMWIDRLASELTTLDPVPIDVILSIVEDLKARNATPHVEVVRTLDQRFESLQTTRLVAVLKAVETIVGRRLLHIDDRNYIQLNAPPSAVVDRFREDLGLIVGSV